MANLPVTPQLFEIHQLKLLEHICWTIFTFNQVNQGWDKFIFLKNKLNDILHISIIDKILTLFISWSIFRFLRLDFRTRHIHLSRRLVPFVLVRSGLDRTYGKCTMV